MPFPYVETSAFEQELQFSPADVGLAESEWNATLSRALKTASERVEGYTDANTDWRADGDTVPFVVQEAVIRLARHRIARIKEDGLESESLASGVSYNYRPPADLRDEVKADLIEAGYRTTGAAQLDVFDVKNT